MEDIIIDVLVDGRVLAPAKIPPAVFDQIEVALVNGDETREIDYEGVCYQWFTRPCVFPSGGYICYPSVVCTRLPSA